MVDKFQFYSKSSDKLPGKGAGEYVKDSKDYKELSNIKDWRKMLSNFWVQPFEIDDEKWNSVEHFYHAYKFRNSKNPGNNYNYYKTFTINGGKSWSKAEGADAWYAGQAGKPRSNGKIDRKSKEGETLPENVIMRSDYITKGINKKVMTLAFFAKFTQNEDLKKVLLATKDAELWHTLSRKAPELWTHLMKVRECIRKYDKYNLKEISKYSSDTLTRLLDSKINKKRKFVTEELPKEPLSISNINLKELLKNGVVVIPGPKDIQKELKNFHNEQIEFVNPSEKETILGGFGAYGNPTSFHHPEIRNIRQKVHSYLWDSLVDTFPDRKAEMLFDRFSKRRKGTSTASESWHRDITNSENVLENDIIYGGWINLDPEGSESQGFSCVPGTQLNKSSKKGFAKFTKEEMDSLNKQKKVFKIPPGHIIMFNQNIAHEILKKTTTFDSVKLYIGWRITDGDLPLYDNTKIIKDQGIIRLPGGMEPPMYYNSHWMFHRDMLVQWSKKIRPEFREMKLFKKEGTYLDVVQQYMTSLRKAGMPLWQEYTEEEKQILMPQLLNKK